MKARSTLVPTLFLALLAGCGAPSEIAESEAVRARLSEGTVAASGVLLMLNDAKTTFSVLDDDVRLDRRAAQNLIAHRNGPDGKLGTTDDDLFDSIAEIDRVKYVGTTALSRIEGYARANGWIAGGTGGGTPTIEPIAGTYDGVYFTQQQAALVLKLVNAAKQTVLDDDVRLDARAAKNIVAARPLPTLKALAGISYVGGTALRLLRDYAELNQLATDCASKVDCAAGESCVGVPKTGAPKQGRCVDTKLHLPGQGASCVAPNSCASGLVCAGELLWGAGDCVPEWMSGEFVDEGAASIPDGISGGTTSSVLVRGLASVPVDIRLKLELTHARPSDLRITLIDPNGDRALVWDQQSGPLPSSFVVRGISGDDEVNGLWSLQVEDLVKSAAGTLGRWSLYLTSRWD